MDNHLNIVAWLESPSGQQTPIRGTCFLGRSATSTIVLADEKVSRRHAMVHAQGENEFWLIDLGSANGTYLNGRRVSQPCRLADKDQLRVGGFTFTFHHARRPRTSETNTAGGTEKTVQEIRSQNCWLVVADIEGSTQFIQRLAPEEAPRVTGLWLCHCKQIVDENRGAINKFLGDGFLAYWVDGQGVAAAVARALKALARLQEHSTPRFRLVLHYGKVYLGGSASLGEDSLMGNDVNFVFRMEKVAGRLGAARLVSEPARDNLDPHLPTTDHGRHEVPSFEGEFRFFTF